MHDPDLRESLQRRLQRFEVRSLPAAGLRHAAVALPLIDAGYGPDIEGLPSHSAWQADAALLLTRRAAGLRSHASQWAWPGGRIDDGESAEQAALRELDEEVGLHLPAAAVLGRLDDYVTRSGYRITPVLVWAGTVRTLRPNPDEVASVHRLPLTELLRPDAPLLHPSEAQRAALEADAAAPEPASVLAAAPVLRMPVGSTWIAAPTAAFLYQFREWLLLDRATRVAHFDQPYFAWR